MQKTGPPPLKPEPAIPYCLDRYNWDLSLGFSLIWTLTIIDFYRGFPFTKIGNQLQTQAMLNIRSRTSVTDLRSKLKHEPFACARVRYFPTARPKCASLSLSPSALTLSYSRVSDCPVVLFWDPPRRLRADETETDTSLTLNPTRCTFLFTSF